MTMWKNKYGEWEVSAEDCVWGPPVPKVTVVEEKPFVKPLASSIKVPGIDKRKVMTMAHQIRRDCPGADFGLCLKEAWRQAKIAALNEERFWLNFADFPHPWEKRRMDAICRDLCDLAP